MVLAGGQLRGGLLHRTAGVRLRVPQQELAGYVCVQCLSRTAAFGSERTDVTEAHAAEVGESTHCFLQSSAVVDRVLFGA